MDDIDLTAIEGAFASSTVDESANSNDEPPDGDYEVTVERCGLRKSSGGNPMVSWMFRIDGPTQAGRCLFRHDVLSPVDPEKLVKKVSLLRTDFHRMGLTLESAAELKTKTAETIGKRLKVRKRTKNGYTDVFINGLAGDPIDHGAPF